MNTSISYDFIRSKYYENRFPFFTGTFDLNLGGIREDDMAVDEFNDILFVAYEDVNGKGHVIAHRGTTKPGLYWLKNKLGNIKGTFILPPGYYAGIWHKDLHRQSYAALCQKPGIQIPGWRDDDQDGELDYGGPLHYDVTGLNMHRASVQPRKNVGPYSAGCQVRERLTDHEKLMRLVDLQIQYINVDSFSYALFRESELF